MYTRLRDTMKRYRLTQAHAQSMAPPAVESRSPVAGASAAHGFRAASSPDASSANGSQGVFQADVGHGAAASEDFLTAAELQAFCPETVMAGDKLQLDFEKSGINISNPQQQERMQQLMSQGYHYAALFNRNLNDIKVGKRAPILNCTQLYSSVSCYSIDLRVMRCLWHSM